MRPSCGNARPGRLETKDLEVDRGRKWRSGGVKRGRGSEGRDDSGDGNTLSSRSGRQSASSVMVLGGQFRRANASVERGTDIVESIGFFEELSGLGSTRRACSPAGDLQLDERHLAVLSRRYLGWGDVCTRL